MSSVDDRTATPRDERKGGERKRKERVESSEGGGRKGGDVNGRRGLNHIGPIRRTSQMRIIMGRMRRV